MISPEVAKLEDDPSAVLSGLKSKLDAIRTLADSVDQVRMSDWQAVKDKVDAALSELQASVDGGEEVLQAMCFLLSQSRKAEKSSRNAATYRRQKIVKRLVGAGWGKVAAKHVGIALDAAGSAGAEQPRWDTDPESFDMAKLTVFEKEGSDMTTANSLYEAIAGSLPDRTESLLSYLAEAEKSGGAMSRLDADSAKLQTMESLFGTLSHLDNTGSSPWLVAARMWTFRHGPAAWPLSGFGCLVKSVSDAVDVVLAAFPADTLVVKGITPADLASFLETPTGVKFLNTDTVFIPLSGSRTVWLPYGWMGSPIVVPKGGATNTPETEGKDDDTGIGIMAVFNPLSADAASKCSAAAWKAIETWNKQHLERNGTRSTWASRADVVKQFCDSTS